MGTVFKTVCEASESVSQVGSTPTRLRQFERRKGEGERIKLGNYDLLDSVKYDAGCGP